MVDLEDNSLSKSIGGGVTSPIPFPNEEELCNRLDEFYLTSGLQRDTKPSQLFRGALYAMRREYSENNPDWMAQVAHSLREILYPFGDKKRPAPIKRSEAFLQHGSTREANRRDEEIGRYYNFVTDIAHHRFVEAEKNSLIGGTKDNPITLTREVFENVVFQFGRILYAVLRRQIDAHSEIDEILQINLEEISISNVRELLELNFDSRQYFFTKADERWLEWLWKNSFLDVIKEKSEDPTRYGYRTPELNYLVKVAEKKAAKVVDIMLTVAVSVETFNPEVVDRFFVDLQYVAFRTVGKNSIENS